jgi:hypothetical protein
MSELTEAQMLLLEREMFALVVGPQHGLFFIDPDTGEQANHGVIIKKRTVADATVWLTYSKADRLWWIIWQDDLLRKLGYDESRRKDCWRTFFELTEVQMRTLCNEAMQ